MLNKRIVIATIAFSLQWWSHLPVAGHHAPTGQTSVNPVRNGCGIDPNGQPIQFCGPVTPPGGTTSASNLAAPGIR